MVRLQRVTLLALHHYLGLGVELMSKHHRGAPLRKQSSNQNEETPSKHSSSLPTDEETFVNSAFRNKKRLNTLKRDELKTLAQESFKTMFGLTDEDIMDEAQTEFLDDIEIVTFGENEVLVEENSLENSALMLVMTGCVSVSQLSVENVRKEMHKAYPGGFLGQLQVLTTEPSFFNYRAVTSGTKVAVLRGLVVQRCMMKYPYVALHLAMSVIQHLSPYVRSIDFAIEWNLVESGKKISRN